MTYLYGKDKGEVFLNNYQALREVAHPQNSVTNLGASIVPTIVNYNELPSIINWCMENDIFPLIGQLEDAGSCSKVYKELEVKEEDLNKFRDYISTTYGVNYETPICPATISGIHITNTNKVILDKRTGLSCPWFWLDEPQLEVIGNIENMSYDEIVERIIKYRGSKFKDVEEMERNVKLYPFGGCGGNIKQLLKTYIDISKKDGSFH